MEEKSPYSQEFTQQFLRKQNQSKRNVGKLLAGLMILLLLIGAIFVLTYAISLAKKI